MSTLTTRSAGTEQIMVFKNTFGIFFIGLMMVLNTGHGTEARDCKVLLSGGARQNDVEEFRRQIREFLGGVVEKKGEPFFKHLNRETFRISILPTKVIDNYDDYVAFQEAWNRNKTGTWSYQFEHLILTGNNSGTAVILAKYEDVVDETRTTKVIRIKDNFIKIGDTWFMTENQNTVLSVTTAN